VAGIRVAIHRSLVRSCRSIRSNASSRSGDSPASCERARCNGLFYGASHWAPGLAGALRGNHRLDGGRIGLGQAPGRTRGVSRTRCGHQVPAWWGADRKSGTGEWEKRRSPYIEGDLRARLGSMLSTTGLAPGPDSSTSLVFVVFKLLASSDNAASRSCWRTFSVRFVHSRGL
jgi:hypothetical protein